MWSFDVLEIDEGNALQKTTFYHICCLCKVRLIFLQDMSTGFLLFLFLDLHSQRSLVSQTGSWPALFKFIVYSVFVGGVLLFSAMAENTVHINYQEFPSALKKSEVSNVSFLKYQEDFWQERTLSA